jgi:hypothetical protein
MFRPTKPSSGRRKVLRVGVKYIFKRINVQVNKPVSSKVLSTLTVVTRTRFNVTLHTHRKTALRISNVGKM